MSNLFKTTDWGVIRRARDRDSAEFREALAQLCENYWRPLYAFMRSRGFPPDEAADMTQTYFAGLLEKDYLRAASPESGRFRSFLLISAKSMLSRERQKARALKRGGGHSLVLLDFTDAEAHHLAGAAEDLTPEQLFEKRWAQTVIERTLDQLRRDLIGDDRVRQFDRLRPYIAGDGAAPPYRQIGADLDMSEDAVKMAVHRLRKRFARRLRGELRRTVDGSDQVDDELRYLLRVLEY